MESITSVQLEHKNWREIKQQKRKWKEERVMKKLQKMEGLEKLKSQQVEVNREEKTFNVRTCSIAVPGSLLQNAQSAELKSYVAGQIARAACIYKISEIVVFNDEEDTSRPVDEKVTVTKSKKYCIQFARLLQYLECPQYLRKYFFPIHSDLQYAGLMNPLDAPHHLRQNDNFEFREGITTDKPVKNRKGTYVNVGLLKEVLIDKVLQPGLRVTVRINNIKNPESKKLRGSAVSPDTPLKVSNIYWGYSVRIANSLSEIFSKCPYEGGYDLTIGTSDKGKCIDMVKRKELNKYKHSIIVFGGVKGLENALENDNILKINNVSLLFDHYLNTCPDQGSRTIRTEEAVFISLAELRKKMYLSFNN